MIKARVRHAGCTDLLYVTTDVLRHTFAKRFLEASESLVTVAVLLSHSRLDTRSRSTRGPIPRP